MCITIYCSLHQELNRGHCLWRGEKRKRKKYVFVDLISSKHFMVSNPFLPQRKFKNSSMSSRERKYKKSYVSARVWVCLPVCFYKQTYLTFLAPLFCFGKAKPQRTHHTQDPCLELTDSRVEEFMYPQRITAKVWNRHRTLRPPPSLPRRTRSRASHRRNRSLGCSWAFGS